MCVYEWMHGPTISTHCSRQVVSHWGGWAHPWAGKAAHCLASPGCPQGYWSQPGTVPRSELVKSLLRPLPLSFLIL